MFCIILLLFITVIRCFTETITDRKELTTTTVAIKDLPTNGVYDHNVRPGTLQWIHPKTSIKQKTDDVILSPVYRLPIDSDDTGAQVQLEWTYTHLKVRPKTLTIEAIGPNKATWTITTMEGHKTTATWDLRETPSYSPLIEGYYAIHVYDQRGFDTLPKPGWLLPDDKLKIALYKTEMNHIGQKIAPSECATCYKYVMQGLEGFEASAVKVFVNCKLISIILFTCTYYLVTRVI